MLSSVEAQRVLQRIDLMETQLADLQEQLKVHKRMLDLWSSLHDHARSRRLRRAEPLRQA